MGPLNGIRVIEIAGIGPAPFACMIFSDLGAEVLRIDRTEAAVASKDQPAVPDIVNRGRSSVAIDLKHQDGVEAALRLVDHADVLVEGFRPGVMERLGLGPLQCMARNPRLVYGRITGWGQDGPLAQAAGHDINYIGLAGALFPMGRREQPPPPPLNLVGNYGGGAMFLVVGVLAALLERARSGTGQVVDAAMIDGVSVLTTVIHAMRQDGSWSDERGSNFVDGSAPFYDSYETADGKFMSVGAVEPKFYAEFTRRLGLDHLDLPEQHDRASWPLVKARVAEEFRRKTRDEWCAVFENSDSCTMPILSPDEAVRGEHAVARETFVDIDGVSQPAPAPRFSRSHPDIPHAAPLPGADTARALKEWGFSGDEIARLLRAGAVV